MHKCLLGHLPYMPSLEHIFECARDYIFKPIHVINNCFHAMSVQQYEGSSLEVLEIHLKGNWNCDLTESRNRR